MATLEAPEDIWRAVIGDEMSQSESVLGASPNSTSDISTSTKKKTTKKTKERRSVSRISRRKVAKKTEGKGHENRDEMSVEKKGGLDSRPPT